MQRLLAFRLELLKRSSEDSMWKYRCKTHLLSLLGAFIVGCVVTAIFFFTNTETYLQILPADVYKFISENIWFTCAAGGLSFAGVINIILIAQMLMSLYNLNPFIFIILIMFAAEPLVILGIVLVVPAIIVCIYGMVSLNKERGKEMKAHNFSQDEELVRMYKLHHKLDENVKSLAENCRKNVNKMTYLYILGIVALFCVLFFIQNIMIATLAFLFYMFLFNILLRYRASCLIPITSLLYDHDDLEGKVRVLQKVDAAARRQDAGIDQHHIDGAGDAEHEHEDDGQRRAGGQGGQKIDGAEEVLAADLAVQHAGDHQCDDGLAGHHHHREGQGVEQGCAGHVVGEQAGVVLQPHKCIAVRKKVDLVEGQVHHEEGGNADEDAQNDHCRRQEQVALPPFLQLAFAGAFIKLDRSSVRRLRFGCFWHTRFLHSLAVSAFHRRDQPALAISWFA